MSGVDTVLSQYSDATPDKLIPLLQDIQEAEGYLSMDALQRISDHLGLPISKVFGVATFYNQFRFKPLGKHPIVVCRGTACHVRGSAAVLEAFKDHLNIEPGDTTEDGLFSLEVVACIGACGLAPVITVGGEVFGEVKPKQVKRILTQVQKKGGK